VSLEDRIRAEQEACSKQCGVRGCTNQATHTWSGHPTCDDCGLPGRQPLPFPGFRLLATPEDLAALAAQPGGGEE
jgi:hypothetical protein